MAEPLNVECPDCTAPAGTPCYTSVSALAGSTHAERQRIADLRALEHGTCALCGGPMVRGSVEGSPVDAWHADAAFAAACPPLPDPRTHYNAWAEAQNLGLTAGHPGAEHFIPDPPHRVTVQGFSGVSEGWQEDAAAYAKTHDLAEAILTRAAKVVTDEQRAALAAGEAVTVEVPVDPDPGRWGAGSYSSEVVGICPECAAEKHINCVGDALNPVTDEIGPCGCKEAGHA